MAALLLSATVAAGGAVHAANSALPSQQRAQILRILPFGDSITRGEGDGGQAGTYNGWRCSAKSRFTSAGITVDYVGPLTDGRGTACTDKQHAGYSGETIAELTARATGLVTTYQPDLVLITAGTNDVIERRDMPNMAARLGVLIDTVHAARPGVQVIVGTLPQIGSSKWCCDAGQVAAWNAYRDAVPGVAATHGARVMYFQRVYRSELNPDAIHPSKCAYESKMAFLVFLAVIDWLRPEGFDPLWAPNSCGASG